MNRTESAVQWVRQHGMSVLIWGSVAFFTLLYLSLIFNDNVWTDEVFTMLCIRGGGLREITELTARDVHPPLYYYYAKIFYVFFGDSIQAQKIASIIPTTLTYVYGATRVRRHFGDVVSLFSILFLACIPCSMEFAVQIRMYSPAVMCVTICAVEAYLAFTEDDTKKRTRHLVFYSAALVGAAYLHYFAFMAVIWIGILFFEAIIIRKREMIKPFLIATVIQVIAYTPWIPYAWQQVTSRWESFWIPPIDAETLRGYYEWAFGLRLIPYVEYAFIVLLVLLVNFLIIRRKDAGNVSADTAGMLALLVPLFTCITGILLSIFPGRSTIYREQYIYPAMGCLALFFGIAVRECRKWILAAICAFLLFVGAVQYRENFRQEYRSTYLNQTRAFLNENARPDDLLMYNWSGYGFIYEYVFRDYELLDIKDIDWEANDRRIWFMDGAGEPMPGGDYFWEHYEIEFVGHYGIEHSEFDLYRIEKLR